MEIFSLGPNLWLVNDIKVRTKTGSREEAISRFLAAIDIEVYHLQERDWLVGTTRITLPDHVEDTEINAIALAFPSANGSHVIEARRSMQTYQIGPRDWMIDGQRVVLAKSTDDTEAAARQTLTELFGYTRGFSRRSQ